MREVTKNMVRVAQINLGKRASANRELRTRLNKGEFDIVLMQEPNVSQRGITGLNSDQIHSFNGDTGGKKIRSAIWVEEKLNKLSETAIVGDFTNKDMTTIRMKLKHKQGHLINLLVCSAYLPSRTDSTSSEEGSIIKKPLNETYKEMIKYCKNNNMELIIGCDANAHNTVWGETYNDIRGESIVEFIVDNNLQLINEGSAPTWQDRDSSSIIDLTLATTNLQRNIGKWKVIDEETHSDHNMITFDIGTEKTGNIMKRNIRKSNFIKYKEEVESNLKLVRKSVNNTEDLDSAADQLCKAIMNAHRSSCVEKTIQRDTIMEWYDKGIDDRRKALRKLYDKSSNRKTQMNEDKRKKLREEYKKERDKYNKACDKTRREAWKRKMEQLEKTKDIARMQKLLENKKAPKVTTLLKENGKYTSDMTEATKLLMRGNFPECKELLNGDIIEEHVPEQITDKDNEIAETVEVIKIKWAVDTLSPYKSPGGDGIFPILIQKAEKHIIPILHTLYIASLRFNYVPKSWRETLITFIPKPGKQSYDKVKSYRPISLMSFFLKILEKLIDRRIRETNLIKNPLSKHQHAYQKGKGTESAIHYISNEIEQFSSKGNITLTTFIDIEGAFDNTGFDIIKSSLKGKGVENWIIKWIEAMLKSRVIKAANLDGNVAYNPIRGCPQGGCLSPLLWSIVIDTLIDELNPLNNSQLKGKFKVSGYADDLGILITGKKEFIKEFSTKMNEALKVTENWCIRNKLNVSAEKSNFMIFSNCNKTLEPYPIKIFNNEIKRVHSIKYLGINFDSKNNWGKHIEIIADRGKRSLFATKAMISQKWGLGPKAMLWIYNQIIIPRITYGCLIWWHSMKVKKNVTLLNAVQRMGLMMVTGAIRSTPTQALEALTNTLPIDLKIEELATKACYRLKSAKTWIAGGNQTKHKSIEKSLETITQNVFTDSIPEEWSSKKFKISINERNNWKYGLHINGNENCWYVDAARDHKSTGIGIYNSSKKVDISLSVSKTKITRTELIAVNECAKIILEANERNKNIIILTDSQTILKSLNSSIINKKSYKECIDNLNKIGLENELTIAWVPAHSDIEGNDHADISARRALIKRNTDINIEEETKTADNIIKQAYTEKAKERWETPTINQVHAKHFIKGFDKEKADEVTKLRRKDIRVVTGFLTGHGLTRSYLFNIHKTGSNKCRKCNQEKETIEHWITRCPLMIRQANRLMRKCNGDVKKIKPKDIINFATATDTYDTFFVRLHTEEDNNHVT